jgi:HSP20 family protein
MWLIFCSLPA